jgi:acyl-CoA thioester hydrolase
VNRAAEQRAAKTTRVELRVRYAETDRMGVAYHGHYFAWFEMARTELMRELGCTYRELEDREELFFPVIRAEARYRASARYDECLVVRGWLAAVGGARVRFEYELARAEGGACLATGFTEHAAVDRGGRPRRIPAEVRRRLSGATGQQG